MQVTSASSYFFSFTVVAVKLRYGLTTPKRQSLGLAIDHGANIVYEETLPLGVGRGRNLYFLISVSPSHLVSPRARWTRLRHQDCIAELLSPSMHSFPMQESPRSSHPNKFKRGGNAEDKRTRLMMLNTTVHEPNHL